MYECKLVFPNSFNCQTSYFNLKKNSVHLDLVGVLEGEKKILWFQLLSLELNFCLFPDVLLCVCCRCLRGRDRGDERHHHQSLLPRPVPAQQDLHLGDHRPAPVPNHAQLHALRSGGEQREYSQFSEKGRYLRNRLCFVCAVIL